MSQSVMEIEVNGVDVAFTNGNTKVFYNKPEEAMSNGTGVKVCSNLCEIYLVKSD